MVCTSSHDASLMQFESGEWPLYVAALHGHLDVMKRFEEVCKLAASVSCRIQT